MLYLKEKSSSTLENGKYYIGCNEILSGGIPDGYPG